MGSEQRQALQADLESVLLRRFHQVPRYGVLAKEGDALSQRYVSLIYGPDGAPLAFGTVKPVHTEHAGRRVRIALFGLAAVDARLETTYPLFSLYFAPLLWMYLSGGFRPFAVAACTMHPALVELVTRHFSDVHPDYRQPQRPSSLHAALARHLVDTHAPDFGYREDSSFEAEAFVLRNTYGGHCAALRRDFHTLRPARDEGCNAFCRSTLDYARGDDLLLIGWVDWRAFRLNLPLAFKRKLR